MEKSTEAALKRAIGMLEATLTRQIGLHRSMLEIANTKRENIIKGDLEGLEQTVLAEKKLVAEIEDEEKKRLAIMPMVQRGLDMPDSADKLADLIERLPEPEKTALSRVRTELRDVIEECRRKTRHNAELLKASLEHVDSFLKAVSEAVAPEVNYKRDGKRSSGGPSIIDRNA